MGAGESITRGATSPGSRQPNSENPYGLTQALLIPSAILSNKTA
jgi:hypothetical protein